MCVKTCANTNCDNDFQRDLLLAVQAQLAPGALAYSQLHLPPAAARLLLHFHRQHVQRLLVEVHRVFAGGRVLESHPLPHVSRSRLWKHTCVIMVGFPKIILTVAHLAENSKNNRPFVRCSAFTINYSFTISSPYCLLTMVAKISPRW